MTVDFDDLAPSVLPTLAVSRNAILAKTGAGKSNTAAVLAEAMFHAGIPWVAIDPKGDWWGVRAGRDGATAGGLPIPIFGGEHGDVPLEPTGGQVIANLVAAEGLTCVVDVSEFATRQQMFRFLREFADALLRRNREVVHVFAEEADDYIPQRTTDKGELPGCLGAWQRLAKKGRNKGIGLTLVSQRSAAVNKDALNMIDTLFAMRVTAPLDRKAIAEWFAGHGVDTTAVDLGLLPSLPTGEALVWSPEALDIEARVRFPLCATFDSRATPKVGEARRSVTLADVDLDAIKDEMAATIERAKADDPSWLKARIRELERDLVDAAVLVEALRAENGAPPEVVEAPFVPQAVLDHLNVVRTTSEQVAAVSAALLSAVSCAVDAASEVAGDSRSQHAPRPEVASVPAPPSSRAPATRARSDSTAGTVYGPESLAGLDQAARKVLSVLYTNGPTLDRGQIALLTGYSKRASTVGNALAKLRAAGFVDGWTITDAGAQAIAGHAERLPTGPALLTYWLHHPSLDEAARRILRIMVDEETRVWTKADLAAAAGYSPTASTVGNALSKLRGLGLVDGWQANAEFACAIR